MNDLLLTVQNWCVKVCSACSAPCKSSRVIFNACDLLVFKFDVWDPTGKVRRKSNINCVPSTSIKIDTCLYKPKASVHYEKTKTAGTSYVSIVSANGKWLHCHNQKLSFVQWPKGARDMYLLLLECTSINNDTGKASSKLCDNILVNVSPSNPVKRKLCNMFDSGPIEKKTCTTTTKDCVVTGFDMPVVHTEWPEYRYYPVDDEWQHNACRQLGLTFVRPFTCVPGGPDVVLRRPVTTSLKKIEGMVIVSFVVCAI